MAGFDLQIYGQNARIVSSGGRVVFAGSLRDCEDWLDATEATACLRHVASRRVARPNLLARLFSKCLPGGGIVVHRWTRTSSRSA